ncbi:hypothetical protein [Pseudarthrobacter sp. NamB4]|uniref:hypothetical protein n=1 Tax=Pseudarthrobacter sp. NamB4 TaxID=2576837 RepID=UPI00148521D6
MPAGSTHPTSPAAGGPVLPGLATAAESEGHQRDGDDLFPSELDRGTVGPGDANVLECVNKGGK